MHSLFTYNTKIMYKTCFLSIPDKCTRKEPPCQITNQVLPRSSLGRLLNIVHWSYKLSQLKTVLSQNCQNLQCKKIAN